MARPYTLESSSKFLGKSRTPLRAIIHEMVRTQVCHVNPKLLVDRISVISIERNGERKEAFRLWLSDGEKSIQAILRRQAHSLIFSEKIREGSYVRLTKYELAQQPQWKGQGSIWVLLVTDLYPVGRDGREASEYHFETVIVDDRPATVAERIAFTPRKPLPDLAEGKALPMKTSFEDSDPESVDLLPQIVSPLARRPQSVQVTPTRKRKFPKSSQNQVLSPRNPNVPSSQGGARKRFCKATDRTPTKTIQEQTEQLRAALIALQSSPSKSRTRAASESPASSPSKRGQPTELPPRPAQSIPQIPCARSPTPSLKQISRPLRITPLANVTGVHATRNKIHDVLVIVTHVNPKLLVRKRFPDSRELLIMDTSTIKQVHLAVFVDAQNFKPKPGTVALFRNLTTHEFGGGSLKAYPQRCAGRAWYVSETPGWDFESQAAQLKRCLRDRPDAMVLPEKAWWTDRGQNTS